MRERILAALKAKFQGVNANILGRIADMLAKTVTEEDQIATAVEGVTKDFIDVIEAYGDSRATDAQRTAVQSYERKYNLKDGEKINNGGGDQQQHDASQTQQTATQPAGGAEAVPAWAQTLIDSNKQLTERLNKMDGERTTATRRQQLSEVVAKLPENLRKPYERISLDTLTDEEFTSLVGEVTTEVEGLLADINTKGAVFGRPAAHNGGGNQGNELTQEQKDAIAARNGQTKEDGQPF